MSTTTDLTTLKINYLTQAQYDVAKSGGTINENEIYMTPTGSLIDLFYPVGSYYETSLPSTINNHSYEDNNLTDEEIAFCGTLWFDPRVAWSGTWYLETEGIVHVSGQNSGTYAVSSAYTDTITSGKVGQKQGGEPTVTLDTTEIPAHTHGSKTLTASFSGRRQGNDYASHWAGTNTTVTQGSGTATSDAAGTTSKHQDVISFSMTHTHDSVGDGAAHENMQPYIAVNRWHRIA